MSKKVFYKNFKLPKALLNDIQSLGLTKGKSGQEMKAIHFISILFDKAYGNMGEICDYRSISRTYLRQVIGDRYYNVVNPLRDNNIVGFKAIASADDGRTHQYNLNKRYFKKDAEWVGGTIRYKVDEEKNMTEEDFYSLKEFRKFYSTLNIPSKEELYKVMQKKADEFALKKIKVNEETLPAFGDLVRYSDGFTSNKRAYKSELLKRAGRSKRDLIQGERGKYYFMNLEDYREMMRNHIYNTWKPAIDDFVEGNLRAVRDKKGHREHTNLTNLPTEIREAVFSSSDIVNLDISNSQFAIFSSIFREAMHGEVTLQSEKFLKAAEKGRLYEVVKEELSLSKRSEAKYEMFLLNFSKASYESFNKAKLKRSFPQIIEWIQDFKQNYGDNEFALTLQKREADIIVDQVRRELKAEGIISSSIHDSVCVRWEDSEKSLEIMKTIFEKNLLIAELKTECNGCEEKEAA